MRKYLLVQKVDLMYDPSTRIEETAIQCEYQVGQMR